MESINKGSAIGMGCVTMGREIDQPASFRLLDYAADNGITFFDTAAAYGDGKSESIIGSWLRENRQAAGRSTIATKVSPPFERNRIIRSVEDSLVRLQTDKIDLLYLHRWDDGVDIRPTLEVLEGLMSSSKVCSIGASNFTAEQLGTAVKSQINLGLSPFRFIQNNHNLAVRQVSAELRYVCGIHGISIVTYSPLAAGFLTGKYRQDIQAGTRFDLVPGHQEIYFHETAYKRLERLQTVARRTGYPPVQLALAWALHQPGVSSVLIGGRSCAHIDQAFTALRFNNPDIFAELENV